MKTTYCATHEEKLVTMDDYERGAVGKTQTICFDAVDIRAETAEGLVLAVGKEYGFAIDDIFWSGDEEDVQAIGFNRLETAAGDEPTKDDLVAWKHGRRSLYLADYLWSVEKRVTCGVERAEFARLVTH